MSFLRKLFGKAPEWAGFFARAEFDAFIAAVRKELERSGLPFRVDENEGLVHIPGGEGTGPQNLGLLNLAQICRSTPQTEWPEVIARHLRIVTSTPARMAEQDALAESFEAARSLLKVRLYPTDLGEELLASMASQAVAEDLIAALVYDYPDSIATVHPSHVEKWGVPIEDLVQTGLRNVWAEGKLTAERIALEDGVWVDLYESGENYFAASHALMLQHYYDPEPELGLLVAVPHRHGMLLRPLDGPAALRSMHAMFWLAPRIYGQGPGSITSSVYWYRAGTFTRLPFEQAGDDMHFYPPQAFTEQVVARLERD